MIIGIDASRANVAQRTGTEWYAFHVLQELHDNIGTEHTVRLYVREDLLDDMLPLPKNWEVRVLNWPPKLLWTQLRLSWEMLWHAPDILYLPVHTIPFIHPQKIISVIHDVGFMRQTELYNTTAIAKGGVIKSLLSAFARIMTRGKYGISEYDYHRFSFDLAVRHATRIITISDFSRDEILDVAPQAEEKITRIYNGIHSRQRPDPVVEAALWERLSTQYLLSEEEYFVTLGRVEEKKNSPLLVQAFIEYLKEGGDGKLLFIGGFGFGAERIQEQVKASGYQDHILFLGYRSDEEVTTLLTHATAFVFPSRYEGFGMPVLEAMEIGVPVLCSDIPVLREIAGDAALFAAVDSVQEWKNGFSQLHQQPELRIRNEKKGKERAAQFSWKRTAQETWAVIEKALY